MMFGYATNETPEYDAVCHLSGSQTGQVRLTDVRKDGTLSVSSSGRKDSGYC